MEFCWRPNGGDRRLLRRVHAGKQRVVFTYCAKRGARTKIATLYGLLSKAGVQTIQIA